MTIDQLKQDVIAYSQRMITDGLTFGTGGNVSAKDAETGSIIITPSGIPYDALTPDDLSVLDAQGQLISGKKPSSEWHLHVAMYRHNPEMMAVVHTHSVFCATLAALGEPIRAVHYLIGNAGVAEVPCIPYHLFGTAELADAVVQGQGKSKAVLLGNHGLVCGERTLKEAYNLAESMEFVAEIQCRAMAIGKLNFLSDDEMEQALQCFKSYGQTSE